MALTNIAGAVALPIGSAPDSGRLVFTLSGWDADGTTLITEGPCEAVLDGAGAYDIALQSTTDLLRQMVYAVEQVYYSRLLRQTVREYLGVIAVPATGGPYSVPELLTIPIITPTAPDVLALAIAAKLAAEDAAIAAAQFVNGFASRAEAMSATILDDVQEITVLHNGIALRYQRDNASTALASNGGATLWGPSKTGPAFLQHWGLTTYSSEAAALSAAAAMSSGDRITQQARLVAAFGEAAGDLVIKGFIEGFDLMAINAARQVRMFSGADFNGICVHASRFNMAASAIFQGGTLAAGGCMVESLHVLCDQTAAAASGLSADLAHYPEALDIAGDFGSVDFLRVSRGWRGINATRTGSANNGGWRFGRLEIGCFNQAIDIDGPEHFVTIADLDIWAHGFAGNANLLALYRAGTATQALFGRCDNLSVDRLGLFSGGKLEIGATAVLPVQIDKLELDADGSSLLLSGGKSIISNLYATQSASSPQLDYQIKCTGGTHVIAACDLVGDSTPTIEVTGGDLTVTGRIYNTNLTVGQGATVSAGRLRMINCVFEAPAGTPILPFVAQSGTGVLELIGCRAFIGGVEVALSTVVSFGTAVAGNRIDQAVGTVRMNSGVVAGAIIERGSNANGSYTKFADGTMTAWTTLAASSGGAATWTFPVAFTAAPVVTGNVVATVSSALCLDAAPSASAATFSARDKTDARRADTCHLRADGRWV